MNVLKAHKKAALLTLAQNKVSQHEIAAKTGIDRKTIRKYQKQLLAHVAESNSPMATGDGVQNPPGWPPGLKSSSACFSYHEFIEAEVKKCRNAMAIYQQTASIFCF